MSVRRKDGQIAQVFNYEIPVGINGVANTTGLAALDPRTGAGDPTWAATLPASTLVIWPMALAGAIGILVVM